MIVAGRFGPLRVRIPDTQLVGEIGGENVRFRRRVEAGRLNCACGVDRTIGSAGFRLAVQHDMDEDLILGADGLVDPIVLLVEVKMFFEVNK